MDIFGDSNRILKLFVEFLGVGQHRTSLDPSRWFMIERDFGETVYADILYLLTRTEFTTAEAREHWFKILEHQEVLREAVGRDMGFQVALVDYFTNIHPLLGNMVFVDVKVLLQKERSTLLDELTGLYNQRFLDRVLKQEVDNANRFNQPLALLIIRIDRFPRFRTEHGRQASDRALAEAARILQDRSRTIDHTVRYGDYEFAVVMPRCGREEAEEAAGNYLRAIREHSFAGLSRPLAAGALTVTIGVAAYPTDANTPLELAKRAGEALKKAEESGLSRAASRA